MTVDPCTCLYLILTPHNELGQLAARVNGSDENCPLHGINRLLDEVSSTTVQEILRAYSEPFKSMQLQSNKSRAARLAGSEPPVPAGPAGDESRRVASPKALPDVGRQDDQHAQEAPDRR